MKKILAFTLALLMSFSCFSIISFAEETQKTTEHLTEVPEGYIGVYTAEDLYWIRNDLTANYILMNDIDLSETLAPDGNLSFMGSGWNPIGSNNSYREELFSGVFDGNGFTVSGMTATVCKPTDITENVNISLFAKNSGEIKNLTMKDCFIGADIDVPSQYRLYAGFIAAQNTGTIKNCFVINSSIIVNECFTYVRAGGISGLNNGFITSSVFDGLVDVYASGRNTNERSYAYAGGISGSNVNGTIEKSINLGEIKSYADGVWGLNSVGHHWSEPGYDYSGGITAARGTIKNCYNKGKIESNYGAGITYDADSVINCYSVGVSLFAISSSSVENSYYIVGAGTPCSGSVEYTDFLMQQINSYNNWDFDTIWTMEGREDYPYPELRDVPLILPEDLNHKHEYTSEVTKEATHLEEGETTYTCACGDSYTEPIAKLEDHTYTSEVTTEPTHLTEGVKTFTCACGDSYTEPVAKLEDHTYTSEVTKKATHLEEGETTYTCACGDSYTEPVAKLKDHTYTSEVTKEATHLEEGETTYICACGDTYTEAIAKLTGHTYKEIVTEPTCTAKGYTIYTCACGDTYTEIIEKLEGHTFAEWTTITKANCSQDGVAIRTCHNCSLTETEITSAFGHSDNNGDYKCDGCGVIVSIPENSGNTEGSGETIIVEKDNVFTFLKSFLNNLIEFFRQLLGMK